MTNICKCGHDEKIHDKDGCSHTDCRDIHGQKCKKFEPQAEIPQDIQEELDKLRTFKGALNEN